MVSVQKSCCFLGLNTIRIGFGKSEYQENTLASLEFYLRPMESNEIAVKMKESGTLGYNPNNCE